MVLPLWVVWWALPAIGAFSVGVLLYIAWKVFEDTV